jgi:hypothetical protein|tara:strand:+ start:1026 stop:1211 length:186 start_codon:yes stop_codon:yes gene_type:complete
MNKDQAIDVLLNHAKKYNDPHYKADVQKLTAAVLFLDTIKQNKQDAKIEITGLQINSQKGV